MFYESHLGDLAFGRASANQLSQEPQAQLPAGASASGSAAGQNAAATQNPAATQTATNPQGVALANTAAGAGAGITGQPAGSSVPQAPASSQTSLSLNQLDPQTHTLVRQQLDVLANQSFAWRGELWPNAPMDWEVARRDAWKELDGTEHPEHWATRLTLNLPSLGQVQARITLANNQLVMHLVSPDAHGLLSERAEELRARYRSQGLQLSQLSVAAFDTVSENLPSNASEATGNLATNDISAEPSPAFRPQGAV
jgi:flagellar hook-length control protein FliK